eukprot:312551-Hanusia_phi.AAC.1
MFPKDISVRINGISTPQQKLDLVSLLQQHNVQHNIVNEQLFQNDDDSFEDDSYFNAFEPINDNIDLNDNALLLQYFNDRAAAINIPQQQLNLLSN